MTRSDYDRIVLKLGVGMGMILLAIGVYAYKQKGFREIEAECEGRGGVFHCSNAGQQSCDCYRHDGRLLLPGERGDGGAR